MSDRFDFYVGQGPSAEWLCGVSGYVFDDPLIRLGCAKTETEFRVLCAPDAWSEAKYYYPQSGGWPWSWCDSRTSDCAYSWHEGRVWKCSDARGWVPFEDTERGERFQHGPQGLFPDFSVRTMAKGGPVLGYLPWRATDDEVTMLRARATP